MANDIARTLEERVRDIEDAFARIRSDTNAAAASAVASPVTATRRAWFEWILSGVSILTIAGGSYWLGGIQADLKHNTERTERVYAVALESKDSLTARTLVLEAKLEIIDKKLDTLIASSPKKVAR